LYFSIESDYSRSESEEGLDISEMSLGGSSSSSSSSFSFGYSGFLVIVFVGILLQSFGFLGCNAEETKAQAKFISKKEVDELKRAIDIGFFLVAGWFVFCKSSSFLISFHLIFSSWFFV
jgi:hypothetical protein